MQYNNPTFQMKFISLGSILNIKNGQVMSKTKKAAWEEVRIHGAEYNCIYDIESNP